MRVPRSAAWLARRAALPLLLFGLSCTSGTDSGPLAAALQVVPAGARLFLGDSLTLSVVAYDGQGSLLPNAAKSFQSDSLSVAIVSSGGVIHAVGLGTAHITVTVDAISRTIPVVVIGAPWAVEVAPAIARLLSGDSVALGARVVDASGNLLTGIAITFQSADASVATVTSSGVISAVGPGSTTVTAVAGALHTSVPVRVFSVQASPSPLVLAKDSSAQLTVTVHDSTGALDSSPALTFQSAHPTIASVSATGLVHGLAFGSTSIGVTYAGLTVSVFVQVGGTHPAGVLDQNVTLGSRPFGVAVAASGLVYVTQLDGQTVSRAQLPTVTFASPITVGNTPTDVAFNSAGTTAYVANQLDPSVGVIDVASGAQTGTMALPAGNPFRVLVSADDQTVYVGTNAGTVLAFDAVTKAVKATYALTGAVNGLALGPTGLVYATDLWGGTLYEINPGTGGIRGMTVGGMPLDVAVSLDGATLYVADQAGPLQVRRASTGALLTTVSGAADGFALRLSPDGAALWVSASVDGKLYAVNTLTFGVQTLATGVAPRRIAFGQQGTMAVVANETGSVLVFK